MLAALLLVPLLCACDQARDLAVRLAPSDYQAEGGALAARFEAVDPAERRLEISLVPVSSGHKELTDIQFPPGDSARMVLLRKSGELVVVELATGSSRVAHRLEVPTASELGLLGLAFPPRCPEAPRLYLNYSTEGEGEGNGTRVSEFQADPTSLALSKERVLLEVDQPYANHNAGQLAFGPDGLLYVGLGDGGWRDDPHGHGQNAETLLGSMLTLDVAEPAPTPQVFAIGLRNPWRYSFDPAGRLIVADVGQNLWEEVNIVPRGANLGWARREGRHCFPPKQEACTTEGLTEPVFEYGRDAGQSITGGHVQTAALPAALQGRYIVGDFASGRIWALALPEQPGQQAEWWSLGRWPLLISTFGRDAQGRVYVGDYGGGVVYRIDEG